MVKTISIWALQVNLDGNAKRQLHEITISISWLHGSIDQNQSLISPDSREDMVRPDTTLEGRRAESEEIYPTFKLHLSLAEWIEGQVHANYDALAMEAARLAFDGCERGIGLHQAGRFCISIGKARLGATSPSALDLSPSARRTYEFNAQQMDNFRRAQQDVRSTSGGSRAFIALGGNVGNRMGMIEEACREMGHRGLKILRTSSIYETEPMYKTDQASFINGVCEVCLICSF